jgi:hypothetical protein
LGWSDKEWSLKVSAASHRIMDYLTTEELKIGHSLIIEGNFKSKIDSARSVDSRTPTAHCSSRSSAGHGATCCSPAEPVVVRPSAATGRRPQADVPFQCGERAFVLRRSVGRFCVLGFRRQPWTSGWK